MSARSWSVRVRRDLEQQRRRVGAARLDQRAVGARDQRRQRRLALQRAQAGRVGRRDVDDHVVRERSQAAGADLVVGGGVLGLLVLAEIDAEDDADRAAALPAAPPSPPRPRC